MIMRKGSTPVTLRGTAMACPHCKGPAKVRSSTVISALARETRHMCEDDECGHVFVSQTQIVRTVAPSRRPDPDIHLRVANQKLRGAAADPQNDNQPPAANDDHPAVGHLPTMT